MRPTMSGKHNPTMGGKHNPTIDSDARWGKGRFAHRLLTHIQNKVEALKPEEKLSVVPSYIREGIAYIIEKVQIERSAP